MINYSDATSQIVSRFIGCFIEKCPKRTSYDIIALCELDKCFEIRRNRSIRSCCYKYNYCLKHYPLQLVHMLSGDTPNKNIHLAKCPEKKILQTTILRHILNWTENRLIVWFFGG